MTKEQIKVLKDLKRILEQNIKLIQRKIEANNLTIAGHEKKHHLLLRYTKTLTWINNKLDD